MNNNKAYLFRVTYKVHDQYEMKECLEYRLAYGSTKMQAESKIRKDYGVPVETVNMTIEQHFNYRIILKIMIEITIQIITCDDCKHCDHTGTFTKGGAKPCCNHNQTVEDKGHSCFDRVIPYTYDYENNGKNRIPKGIPKWCPLKRGYNY